MTIILWEEIRGLEQAVESRERLRTAQLSREIESESDEVQSRHLYTRILDGRGNFFVKPRGWRNLLPEEAFPAAQIRKQQRQTAGYEFRTAACLA